MSTASLRVKIVERIAKQQERKWTEEGGLILREKLCEITLKEVLAELDKVIAELQAKKEEALKHRITKPEGFDKLPYDEKVNVTMERTTWWGEESGYGKALELLRGK